VKLSEFRDLLKELLQMGLEELDCIEKVSTYEEVMMLTRNTGLVIDFADGSQIQMTLVQSRFGDAPTDEDTRW